MNIYQHTNPDKNNTPFTYLIGWSALNKWYYGCRYRKGCHPTDLWTTYFTSSDEVKQFRREHGEPDVIQVRHVFSANQQAKLWESRVQTAIPRTSRIHWLNKKFGDTFANVVDGFTGKKKSAKSKLRQKETMMQKYGVENGGQTEKSKATAKARMLSPANPSYHQTNATKKKISETNLTNMANMTADERSAKFGSCGEKNPFFGKHHSPELLAEMQIKKSAAWAKNKSCWMHTPTGENIRVHSIDVETAIASGCKKGYAPGTHPNNTRNYSKKSI